MPYGLRALGFADTIIIIIIIITAKWQATETISLLQYRMQQTAALRNQNRLMHKAQILLVVVVSARRERCLGGGLELGLFCGVFVPVSVGRSLDVIPPQVEGTLALPSAVTSCRVT